MNKKWIMFFFMFTLFSFKSFATSCGTPTCKTGELYYSGQPCPTCVSTCPSGTYAALSSTRGPICQSAFPSNIQDCYQCQLYYYRQQQATNPYYANYHSQLPWMTNPYAPWWATQGNYSYPNFQYPGAWYNHGINTNHYPGNGGAVALKPNIYVKNEKIKLTKFSWKFAEKEKAEFLATTPALKNFGWEGLVSGESFRVSNVGYSYLFYDARMDHNKMQYSNGICIEKEGLVPEMMMDLKAKGYPEVALKDFNEHWTQKIPNYPYYCIYPQYSEQMNALMPIEVTPTDAVVTRVLFVLVPHSKAPKVLAQKFPALPTRAPASLMPVDTKPRDKSIHFLEWGVAFLDEKITN